MSGTYAMAWGITASGNLNVVDGANRTLSVNGVATAYGGISATTGANTTISYGNDPQLTFQPTGTTRLASTKLLDLGAQKVFTFRGGKNRLKLMFDAFNVFNVNTITSYLEQQSLERELQRPDRRSFRRGSSASARKSCSKQASETNRQKDPCGTSTERTWARSPGPFFILVVRQVPTGTSGTTGPRNLHSD